MASKQFEESIYSARLHHTAYFLESLARNEHSMKNDSAIPYGDKDMEF